MPLIYAVRNNAEVDFYLSPQEEDKPHSAKCGSTESDVMHVPYHDHSWCREDDS